MPKFNKDRFITDSSYTADLDSAPVVSRKDRNSIEVIGEHLGIDWDDTITVKEFGGQVAISLEEAVTRQKRLPSREQIYRDLQDDPSKGLTPTKEQITVSKYGPSISLWNRETGEFNKEHARIMADRLYRSALIDIASEARSFPSKSHYIVEGIGPDGEEIIFLKMSTGFSYLYIDGVQIHASKVAKSLKSRKKDSDPFTDVFRTGDWELRHWKRALKDYETPREDIDWS